ncbi:ATP-grasp domain-containing protein [Nonomuraea guangzhouensis]|uniref:ATP-grasp domain-containing protein n=1 Tax=Nonomuraea guangzhouensis TaxID=1291555 RepID=A0ABW4GVA8_9ACTN|nr:ATP-grasp domain-containing protein [Nonomuraea guangzhouensis]
MRRCLAFIEANTTGTGMMALRTARDLGLEPLFFTGRPERYRGLAGAGAEVVLCDTNDTAALRAAVARWADRLCGVTTTSDFYVAAAAELAAALGLPGNPPEVVRLCRDKGRMRRALAGAGVRQPRFEVITEPGQVPSALARVGLPCVAKPVDGSGSEHVRLCESEEEALDHVGQVLAVRTNVRGQASAGAVLLEEYLRGPEFSVETFHVRGEPTCVGVVAKTVTGHPYFVESGHVYPAPLAPLEGEAIVATTQAALAAVGVRDGPTHTEVKLLPDGVAIVEINPRLAGGMIPELVRLVDGLDLLEQQLRGAAGMPVTLATRRRGYAGVRFLTAERAGVLRTAAGWREAELLPGVESVVVTAEPGTRVSPPRSAYDRLGHVIARGRTVRELSARLEAAVPSLLMEAGERS